MLLTDTAKTKETALQKQLIEKRNLFGLGVTSLIAACSADGAGGGGSTGGGETEEERIAREAREAEEALDASVGSFFGYDFVPGELGTATKQDAKIPSSVGYRFSAADSAGLDTLLKVQGAYEGVSKLSDADADLGVWDIA